MFNMAIMARSESLVTEGEREFQRFCKKVAFAVGDAAVNVYESEILGMYEDGASPDEVADEIKAMAKSKDYLRYSYLYPQTVTLPFARLLNPVDDFGTEILPSEDEWNEKDPLTGAWLNPMLIANVAYCLDSHYYPACAEGIYK